jgi:hydroxyacyl-ACP dehydratase HTD2-like protein with hotdog domain
MPAAETVPTPLVDSMSPELAQRLASVVQPERRVSRGDALPPLWQWAYFGPVAPTSELGTDGHPRREGPWAERFPRRMAGGGRVEQLGPLVVGLPAEKRSQLQRAEEKLGRSGPLLLCDWRHTYLQSGVTVIEELQTLVYRPEVHEATRSNGRGTSEATLPSPHPGPSLSWQLARKLHFDPVTLFRFSAATWNAHRIHYDREYALREGYSGLVVHGPLLTMLMAQEAQRSIGDLAWIEFRYQAPVIATEMVELYIATAEDRCQLEARKQDGTVASSLMASNSARRERHDQQDRHGQ